MKKLTTLLLLPLFISIGALLAHGSDHKKESSFWGDNEIEDVMDEMQGVMRRVRRVKTADDLLTLYEEFRGHVINGLKLGDELSASDKKIYLDGMNKVLDVIDEAITAAKSGDLKKAKSYLSKLRNYKKNYHKKLNVDD